MSDYACELHIMKAKQFADKGLLPQAVQEYQEALALQPNNAQVMYALSQLSVEMNMQDVALQWADLSLSIEDNNDVKLHRASVLVNIGKNEEAIEAYAEIEKHFKMSLDYYVHYGALLLNMRHCNKAISVFKKALNIAKKYGADANNIGTMLNNIGLGHYYMQDYREAINYMKKSLKYKKDDPMIMFNLGTAYLKNCELVNGWKYYEYRLDPDFPKSPRWLHSIPEWKGESLTGKSILLGNDQGIGDVIIFSTSWQPLVDKAKKVIVETHPKLVPLLQNSYPDIEFRNPRFINRHIDNETRPVFLYGWIEEEEREIEYYKNMGSVFGGHRQSFKDFLVDFPVLKPDMGHVAELSELLSQLNTDGLPMVGLSWRSTFMSGARNLNYTTAEAFGEQIQQIDTPTFFVNLQYGFNEEEIETIHQMGSKKGHKFINIDEVDLFNDLYKSAALIYCMDYLVLPNNTQYSIAAGLGKPVIYFGPNAFAFKFKAIDPIFPTAINLGFEWSPYLNDLLSGKVDFIDLIYQVADENGDMKRYNKLFGETTKESFIVRRRSFLK